MNKKISFGPKPTGKPLPPAADSWVESRTEKEVAEEKAKPERMKRLTIDIPLSLHRAIKSQCAASDKQMADEIRQLLTQKYGKS